VFAGLQRKFKRNFQGGMGTGYTTSDEVWCHFKPTKEQLEKWINEEGRGDKRIDEQSAVKDDVDISNDSDGDRSRTTALSDADDDERVDDIEAKTAPQSSKHTVSRNQEDGTKTSQGENSDDATDPVRAHTPAEDGSYDAPPDTWLGMVPSLRDGPRSS
jgi:platelet-activating factor acetylhydrolase